jgi:hypothetical protein
MAVNSAPPYEPVNVDSEFWFLKREAKHAHDEKPFKLRYDPGPDIPRQNCLNESVEGITVYDIRGNEDSFSIEHQGFTIGHLRTKLVPEDFDDEDKIKGVYYEEIKELLKNSFGCQRVEVLEHGVSNVSAHVEIFC